MVDFINGFLEKKDMNSKIISQIDIAVDEICSNIFNYAYKNKKGQVLVEISYKDNAVTIRFVDTGVKFNPLEKEDPDKAHKEADEIIKNTYRTLMTRGMKGCYIYCTDPSLAEYLKKRVNR